MRLNAEIVMEEEIVCKGISLMLPVLLYFSFLLPLVRLLDF